MKGRKSVSKPRVCIMTSVHRHDDVRIYHKEARSLRERGCEVTILCSDYEGVDESGIRFVKVEVPAGRIRRILFSPGRFFKAAKKTGAEYFHFHDPELMRAGLKLRKYGKTVYDVHEDVPSQILTKPYLKPGLAKLCSKWFEKYERRAARRFDAIVAAEPVIYARMKHLNRNTYQVCNYPILEELAPSAEGSPRKRQVCYLGGITRIRGIHEMLDAVAGTDITLVLAGDFENDALRREAEAHPGWKNVSYLGYIGRKEVSRVLSESGAGLVILHPIPKYLTALPVKMFEYMAAGVPVIASNFPYWKQILEDSHCGLCVDPLNPEEIRMTMEYILKNPDIIAEMGQNGRTGVVEQYNWATEKQKLFELYGC